MTGRQADVIQAAHLAAEIAHRMVVPGGEVCVCVCVSCLGNWYMIRFNW